MVAGNRLELGNVEGGEDRAQRQHARPAALAARPGRRQDRVARIEQDRAALLHIGVGPRQRLGRGARRVRHHRPIDQREEGKLVTADIDADRLARLERGTLRQEQGQALQPGLAGGVDIGISGDHVSQPRLQRGLHGEIIGDRIGAAAADPEHARGRDTAEDENGRGRAPPRDEPMPAAAEREHHKRIDHEQHERGNEHDAAEILGLAEPIRLDPRSER